MQKAENNANSANSNNVKYSIAGEIGMKNAKIGRASCRERV